MFIDFHVHAFADAIAERAISNLEKTSGCAPCTRGTVSETVEILKAQGIDKGVLLPIATKPSQQKTINDWAKTVEEENPSLICFGSVHPDAEDVFEEIERIKALGLHGIKLHPDYQNFFIDEERLFPIYRKCAEEKLPVIFHGGFDPLSPDVVHALPAASLKAHRAVPEMTMILAHLGGMLRFDEVEELLAGENIYFDTAFLSGHISDEQARRIFKKHGADKILLGSDCPWSEAPKEIELIRRLGLSNEEEEMLFHKNAERLLGI